MRRMLALLAVVTLGAGCAPQGPEPASNRCEATIEGKVLERQDRPPYSYLRVSRPQGSVWVALPVGDIGPGAIVRARPTATLRNHPIGPDRRLDAVCFGTLVDCRPDKDNNYCDMGVCVPLRLPEGKQRKTPFNDCMNTCLGYTNPWLLGLGLNTFSLERFGSAGARVGAAGTGWTFGTTAGCMLTCIQPDNQYPPASW